MSTPLSISQTAAMSVMNAGELSKKAEAVKKAVEKAKHWENDELLDAIAEYLGERGCPMPDENPAQLSAMITIGRQYHQTCYVNGWVPSVDQVAEKVGADHLRSVQHEAEVLAKSMTKIGGNSPGKYYKIKL
jgi:hypothetical protein